MEDKRLIESLEREIETLKLLVQAKDALILEMQKNAQPTITYPVYPQPYYPTYPNPLTPTYPWYVTSQSPFLGNSTTHIKLTDVLDGKCLEPINSSHILEKFQFKAQ